MARSESPITNYPESYIRLLTCIRLLFHLPYRQTEGFVTFLSKHVEGLKAPDYSTIDRRVNKLEISLDDSLAGCLRFSLGAYIPKMAHGHDSANKQLVKSNAPVSIAVDSSGIKVHNGGETLVSSLVLGR